jgi:TRAP-type transport system periplasmic protein
MISLRPGIERAAAALLLIILLLTAAPFPAAAQGAAPSRTVLKMATLVPEGSIWHRILTDQAAAWRRASGGSEIRIYAGGVAGDDPDIVRKMRIGQFQLAALSSPGLTQIDEAFHVFGVPMLFASPEEAFYVLDAMTPLLRQRLDERGYVLINWGYAGWAHFYSKRPIRSPAELRSRKLFLWGGDERAMRIWRENGLQPIGLASTDIMMALQTGMIDVFATTPLATLSLQWHRLAPHQLDPGLAPLLGATVMTKRAWNNLSPPERDALLQTGRDADARFRREIPAAEQRAITAMQERGLSRNPLDRAAEADWNALATSMQNAQRGRMVPPDIYDSALRLRNEYRTRPVASKN